MKSATVAVGLALLCLPLTARANEPALSICTPVTVAATHLLAPLGDNPFAGNQRLAPIEAGKVPCMHWASLETAECSFRTDDAAASGNWLEDKYGRLFAQVGQPVTKDGVRGGPYIVAARADGEYVPCVAASGFDTAGVPAGEELAMACVRETMKSPFNATGQPLQNYATIPVCTSSNPHPDGAQLASADGGVFCYIGRGAGLNDPDGRERDATGVYLRGNAFCHVGFNSGMEVPAAKRPSVTSGWPKKVDPRTPIVWLPYVSGVRIAN